jgi:sugar (pentulose or hexulose) kinase
MSPGSDKLPLDETRDTLLNVSVQGNPVPSSKFMGGREYDYLSRTYQAEQTDKVITNVLEKEAFILPAVESTTGPFPRTNYLWTIDPLLLSAEERYNVISFYLALMTETCLSLCHSKGPIIVEGPFTKNIPFCTMLNAATGREVSGDTSGSTGTSIGAALLAYPASGATASQYSSLAANTDREVLQAYCKEWQHKTALHSRIS